eukprot:GHVR01136872.1.p1 GENE.GHVR01136872.1~~GHVR01136872.1.p1  ORF type:complete len:123 (+),score=19.72 GHVR01136872.1:153-521(+)
MTPVRNVRFEKEETVSRCPGEEESMDSTEELLQDFRATTLLSASGGESDVDSIGERSGISQEPAVEKKKAVETLAEDERVLRSFTEDDKEPEASRGDDSVVAVGARSMVPTRFDSSSDLVKD